MPSLVRFALPLVVASTLLVLAGALGPATDATGAASSSRNATDVVFVRQMTPHPTGGVALGRLAVERGVPGGSRPLAAGHAIALAILATLRWRSARRWRRRRIFYD